MASVTSQNASPHAGSSPYDFDSNGDTDESWQYIDYSSGASVTGSIGFLPSPASGSLNGFAIVGHVSTPSQGGLSPGSMVDMDPTVFLPASTTYQQETEFVTADLFSNSAERPPSSADASFSQGDAAFMTPQQYLFMPSGTANFQPQELNDLTPFMNDFPVDSFSVMNQTSPASQSLPQQNVLQSLPSDPSMSPWNQTSPSLSAAENKFVFEEMISSPSQLSTASSSSPRSPAIKSEASSKSGKSIRKVIGSKVEKNKSDASSSKFVIVTPTTISARAGKPNPFECFEAMRTTQKGRKGPLANETKESALQVRRVGACFCCHSRKVKCDKERPCKHCKKLMLQVPQVVCWQFQDFLPVLFPEFIRGHFKKDVMASFITENVEGFTVNGAEQFCNVELSSGPRFATTLTLQAKFFTAKTCDVLQHWHLSNGEDHVDLQSQGSAPIGIEVNKGPQKDEMKKLTKGYIQALVNEPLLADQLTDSFRSTRLPNKILSIVQNFAKKSDSTMVKRALSIYTMHYVMTRHLCLTRQSILSLQPTGLVPQNTPWVTPRVLARQIKSLIDELILRDMQHLFELFSKSLKPKLRREWAPCLASFLVLCLFMEAVETAADNFVVSQNEIDLRNKYSPKYKRSLALDTCKELENMPFKQFAYQFHHLYQTHTKDANTRSFNPLFDNSFVEQGELDPAAVEMVQALRELFHGEDWQDMQFLADDELLLHREEHPYPMDTSFLYTGRLVAKFLLSFTNESVIFASKI
ncbi:Zn(2)-C6 fungal-type domain-containing protein [Trichoderma simmonsii]|uniref:Zn(2)-C6 fungal-type domain-containing protein n=1 Tax=Trichoderma simmonsii TaxID=1491479 RepID=A0A8G0L9P3_9HYPO|nr:Zn(2)-C6 fungal-type domain-containing protein [Trichoderma simmonsii]